MIDKEVSGGGRNRVRISLIEFDRSRNLFCGNLMNITIGTNAVTDLNIGCSST